MKRISLLLFTAIICLFFSLSIIAGNSDKQIRPVGSFSSVKVSSGIDLYLESGSQEKVTVESDNDDLDDLITEVKDGTLHIYIKRRPFNLNFRNSYEVHVTAKTLVLIDASAGSEVKGQNLFQGSECTISASSGSEIHLEVNYDKLKIESSSGSEISLSGKSKHVDISVSSGSEIDACELEAAIARVDASSGGDACVNVTAELHANASSGGDIAYKGSPASVDANKSSGGHVSKK
jgi:hypothetical protein